MDIKPYNPLKQYPRFIKRASVVIMLARFFLPFFLILYLQDDLGAMDPFWRMVLVLIFIWFIVELPLVYGFILGKTWYHCATWDDPSGSLIIYHQGFPIRCSMEDVKLWSYSEMMTPRSLFYFLRSPNIFPFDVLYVEFTSGLTFLCNASPELPYHMPERKKAGE